ncbi:hypothetical protein [Rhodobium gokarnense]|uniref:ABC-type cobalamin transport system permease subunit n=1 Tax=Rhodobium gokarnense TaxID=364296 RepID=A0ABT3H9F0_9HYPH|nr:hypothetical protein [Rhodobium gokarnense]MCW2306959.1 ABC-type cobalamin transport system permease subunit [Rhodobium gokarnense]
MTYHPEMPYAGQGVPAVPYPAPQPASGDVCADLVRLALMGAVVGGSIAAASGLRKVRRGEIQQWDMTLETTRGAVLAGAATAISGVAARAVTDEGIARLGMLFAGGVAAYYGLEVLADRLDPAKKTEGGK